MVKFSAFYSKVVLCCELLTMTNFIEDLMNLKRIKNDLIACKIAYDEKSCLLISFFFLNNIVEFKNVARILSASGHPCSKEFVSWTALF